MRLMSKGKKAGFRRGSPLRAGLALMTVLVAPDASAAQVLVFAAASLTDAMAEVGAAYEARTDNTVRFSFASSSILARQIAQGAPAQIYISANIKWMDYLANKGKILPASRKQLLANQLVLIAPQHSSLGRVKIRSGFALARLLGHGHLAMGNPAHVPAGIYGKQALQSLHVWSQVKARVVRSANVRAALALVARGEVPLGIVYRSDAMATGQVRIVGVFPAASHNPVLYLAALTHTVGASDQAAREFFAFMACAIADRILASYGFKVLD